MAKEGIEEGGDTQENHKSQLTLKEKIQALFNAGAIFSFGQKQPPVLARGIKYEPTQPLLSGCNVQDVHDGGAWIGITLADGRRCKTTCRVQAERLRQLAEKPEKMAELYTGIHLDPVHAVTA
ncbi:MAG: hypothetical protein ACAH17_00435 [Candidatus Paceibacterota bacterium]